MRRFVRPVVIWYGVACWLVLSTLVLLPDALPAWFPALPVPPALALGHDWRILFLIALITGIAVAWQTARELGILAVVGSLVAVTGATVVAWVVYLAVIGLPQSSARWTQLAQAQGLPQSAAMVEDVVLMLLVSVSLVLQGIFVGAAGGFIGFGLHALSQRLHRTPSLERQ